MNTLLGFPEGNVATRSARLRRWRGARHEPADAGHRGRHLDAASELPRDRPRAAEPRDGAAARRHARRPARRAQRAAGQRRLRAGLRRAPARRAGARTGPPRPPVHPARSRSRSPPSSSTAQWNIVMGNEASQRDLRSVPTGARRGRRTSCGRCSIRAGSAVHRQLGGSSPSAWCTRFTARWRRPGSDAMVRAARRAARLPGCAVALEACPIRRSTMPPLVSMQLRKDDLSMTFFSMITMLGTPRDVDAAAAEDRVLLPGGRGHRAARRVASPPRAAADRRLTTAALAVTSRVIVSARSDRARIESSWNDDCTFSPPLSSCTSAQLLRRAAADRRTARSARSHASTPAIGVPLDWDDTRGSDRCGGAAIRIILLPYETGDAAAHARTR